LSELRSLELKLSTDQDCALIMERLLHSMGDWGRRVVADSFAGQYVFDFSAAADGRDLTFALPVGTF
jgi:hypothetical protein